MPFRFVHAADIHLDSPLSSLAMRNSHIADLIGDATRQALSGIVDLCLEEQVDALLLSGDLYDGEQTSMKTARFLADQMRRLHGAGIDVFVIRGNHDALSKITKELTLPENVRIFNGRGEMILAERGSGERPIAIHGLSFSQPHAPESLLGRYKAPVDDAINIGLMHTSLDGAPGHDLYAPCSVADLKSAGFDYWALGHIHKRAVHPGNGGGPGAIVMPGIPQGRDINEDGPKGVSLVTIRDDRSIVIEERLTSLAEFHRVEADVDGLEDWKDVVLAIERALEAARREAQSEQLVARVSLSGRTPVAWRLRRDADLLAAEAEDRAGGIGKTWIDKIEIRCSDVRESRSPDAGDPVAELKGLMDAEILGDPAYLAAVQELAEDLRGQLPAECRDVFGGSEDQFAAMLKMFAREGTDDVIAALRASAEAGSP